MSKLIHIGPILRTKNINPMVQILYIQNLKRWCSYILFITKRINVWVIQTKKIGLGINIKRYGLQRAITIKLGYLNINVISH